MESSTDEITAPAPSSRSALRASALTFIGLLLVLLLGAYFRFTGLFWGEYEYPHPDERFLVWVVADIAPVDSVGDYFDTARSSLNPANRGHAFYVYGDFPVILTRYVAESVFDYVGWMEILQTGRGLSALFDLVTVLLVFLTARRLAGGWVGFIAGLLSAAAVLQIQQSHFFTVDSFSTTFSTLALYLGVNIAFTRGSGWRAVLWQSVLLGAAVGMAMACKINTVVVAAALPTALILYYLRQPREVREQHDLLTPLIISAMLSGAVAFLVFRIAQPYAFAGPGFFNISIDPGWKQSIDNLRAQSAGDVDFPPGLQWADRSKLFSFQNLSLYGIGVPFAILAWSAVIYYAVLLFGYLRRFLQDRDLFALVRGLNPGLLLIWGWTVVYFLWQSMSFNPTMRYQLPIYPTLAVLAAWLLSDLWTYPRQRLGWLKFRKPRAWRAGVFALGTICVLLTLAWAFAFTRIYIRPETRVAASRWILQNVPGPVNLEMQVDGDPYRQLLSIPGGASVEPGAPYALPFTSRSSGALTGLTLTNVQSSSANDWLQMRVQVLDVDVAVATADVTLPAAGNLETSEIPFAEMAELEPGKVYTLVFELIAADGSPQPMEGMGFVGLNGPAHLTLYAQAQTIVYKQTRGLFPITLEHGGALRSIRMPEGSLVTTLSILVANPLTGEQYVSQAYSGEVGGGQGNGLQEQADGENVLRVDPPLTLQAGIAYEVAMASMMPNEPFEPGETAVLEFMDQPTTQALPAMAPRATENKPLWTSFTAQETGTVETITLAHAAQVDHEVRDALPVLVELIASNDSSHPVASARGTVSVPDASDPRGAPLTLALDAPVRITQGETYSVRITPEGPGALVLRGSAPANESTWDMGLPFRMDGYDPYGGLYRNDLNFEMYWDDTEDKRQRFLNILDQSDYIFMSSNRQWGTTTRLPARHPLTTAFYRALLGCPIDREVIWCYNVAERDTFTSDLGWEVAAVFTSYPNLGPVEVNTQFAEEAFTVYDHPKVFVFRKTDAYSSQRAQEVLGAVDLDKVVHVKPKEAADYKDMLLSARLWAVQQAGGTWAALFPPDGLLNRSPWLAAVAYYLFMALFGALIFPLVRLALPGLPDGAYPLGRITAHVLLAYLAWIAGSAGVPVTRGLLLLLFLLLSIGGLAAAFAQRDSLRRAWAEKRGILFTTEAVALAFFVLMILIRLGNPDLWHPVYGGEKPMNVSYFNAVLKSTVFPAYDPWFAGGSMNYYYYGYVIVGMPIKLLGIDPAVAYNLVLPGLFSMCALGAWMIGRALMSRPAHRPSEAAPRRTVWWLAPLVAAAFLLLIGNQGTVRMFWQGWQKIVVSDQQMAQGSMIDHIRWAGQGLIRNLRGDPRDLPYYPGDWYWKPSRAIQPEAGGEITEFPFFTFLYADLHAHLMALPVTLLVIAWALGVVLGRARWRTRWSLALALLIGALAVGSLRPTNTWDQYTYLILAAAALFYAAARAEWGRGPLNALARAALLAVALAALSVVLYRPFDAWFAQAYNAVDLWRGAKTNIPSYLVHWSLFLFLIAAWMFDELIEWMASTPLSALRPLVSYLWLLPFAGLIVLAALALLLWQGVIVSLIIVPLGLVAAALLFRPNLPETKRAALFFTGTALLITLVVELVSVRGDIGRMNTVFKFYYQAWTLLALSAAAALVWLAQKITAWRSGLRIAWQVGLGLLLIGPILFPFTAARAKLTDRMVANAPNTLDGMRYMEAARYYDGPTPENYREMDLSQDYRAIKWMQANVIGSPVIVEANTPEYRHWGTRYTIYTGLPGVIGWNWHQRQQRALTPDTWVWGRIGEVRSFYTTTSQEEAEAFLRQYNVEYIILGQLERIYYDGPGLGKFAEFEGVLWDKVYEEGQTVIYQVR